MMKTALCCLVSLVLSYNILAQTKTVPVCVKEISAAADSVSKMAEKLISTGFTAGDGCYLPSELKR